MQTYYFDMKDGIPTRDRTGLEFATRAGAIEHSRDLARRLRHDPRITDRRLRLPGIALILGEAAMSGRRWITRGRFARDQRRQRMDEAGPRSFCA